MNSLEENGADRFPGYFRQNADGFVRGTKAPYYSNQSKGNGIGKTLLWAGVGAAGLTAAFLIGRKLLLERIENKNEGKTLDEGSPHAYAKQFKMAFENNLIWGMGTDENSVYAIMQKIASKEEYKKTATAYTKLYHQPLEEHLYDELSSEEYNYVMALLAAKPEKNGQQAAEILPLEKWSKTLYDAFEYTILGMPATDEEAINQVIAKVPTLTAFGKLAQRYAGIYNQNLIERLRDELTDQEYLQVMQDLNKKPKA
jgi:hypothetical protein